MDSFEATEPRPTPAQLEAPMSPAGEATSGAAKVPVSPVILQGHSAPPATQPAPHSDAAKPTANAPASKSSYSLEDANEEIYKLTHFGKASSMDVAAIKSILTEHAALKDKTDKLKALLGRSAKAQRETKVDLEATQKRLTQALREIERLNQKLEKLQTRPTHSTWIPSAVFMAVDYSHNECFVL